MGCTGQTVILPFSSAKLGVPIGIVSISRQTTSTSKGHWGKLSRQTSSFDEDGEILSRATSVSSDEGSHEQSCRCDVRNWPPLILATQKEDLAAVCSMLKNGAKPDCCEPSSGWTPLMYAAAAGNRLIISELIRAGADINHVARPFGWGAVTVAIMTTHEDIVWMLLDAGADLVALRRHHPELKEAAMERDARRRETIREVSSSLCRGCVKDYDQYC